MVRDLTKRSRNRWVKPTSRRETLSPNPRFNFMRSTRLGLLLLLITACGPACSNPPSAQVGPNSTTASPSHTFTPITASPSLNPASTPTAQPASRLLVTVGQVGGQEGIFLVSRDGRVVASVAGLTYWENVPFPGAVVGAAPGQYFLAGACCGVFLPYVSVSNRRVYFTAGQDEVRYLGADGTTGLAVHLPNVKGRTRSVFAVSSDDLRIAFSVFDWSVLPMAVHMYVENVGGGNQVEIFSSSSAYEWPVAWHGNNLVVGVDPVLGGGINPYAVKAYHLASASTGLRIAVLGSSTCPVTGPLTPFGTACTGQCGAFACVESVDWNGQQRVLYQWQGQNEQNPAALSPDGSKVVISDMNLIASADGSTLPIPTALNGLPIITQSTSHWWLDDDTLAIDFCTCIFQLSSRTLTTFSAPGQIVGILPGGLG